MFRARPKRATFLELRVETGNGANELFGHSVAISGDGDIDITGPAALRFQNGARSVHAHAIILGLFDSELDLMHTVTAAPLAVKLVRCASDTDRTQVEPETIPRAIKASPLAASSITWLPGVGMLFAGPVVATPLLRRRIVEYFVHGKGLKLPLVSRQIGFVFAGIITKLKTLLASAAKATRGTASATVLHRQWSRD